MHGPRVMDMLTWWNKTGKIFLSNCRIFLTNEKAIKNRFQCALWSRDCYPTSHYLIYYMALSRCLLCTLPLFSKLYIPSTIKTQLNCILFFVFRQIRPLGQHWTFLQFCWNKYTIKCVRQIILVAFIVLGICYNFGYHMPTHNDPETRIYFWKPLSHKSGPLYLLYTILNCIFQNLKLD